MKEYERLSIGLAMGSSIAFLFNLFWFDYKVSLTIYLFILLICVAIWICGEYTLAIYKDVKKLREAEKNE